MTEKVIYDPKKGFLVVKVAEKKKPKGKPKNEENVQGTAEK